MNQNFDNAVNYMKENKKATLQSLFELLSIKTISSDPAYKSEILKGAKWVENHLHKIGVTKTKILDTGQHPLVFGEYSEAGGNKPTILIYGHYDVQPPEPLNLWKSKPFSPTIINNLLFARGASDMKGQLMVVLTAIQAINATSKLPVNLKFLIEGEEEIGSPSLEAFCEEHKEMLQADTILVSDTGMIAQDIPSITTGLRGLSYMEVKVTGPNKDLHSGIFGGAVANPANILAQMIASLTDENNHITIPGFYDDVLVVSDEERKEMAKAPFDLEEYKKALDIDEVWGEKGYSTNERTGIRPSLDVNGIWSGYTGEGAKTVLPSVAFAKISMRLVPNQDNEKISELFEAHFKSIAPPSVKVEVTSLHGGQAYVSPMSMPAYKAADKAYTQTFNKKPVPTRSGGSIPIISTFEKVLGIKSVLMGFGLESDAIHSPNENYPLFNFYKGIETISWFYKFFEEEMRNQ